MADPTSTMLRPDLAHAMTADREPDGQFEDARRRRQSLQSRHTQALAKLLQERDDLRGVHALADLVADSLRWSA